MADLEQLLHRLDDIESLLVKSKAAPESRADPAALVEELRGALDAGREVWNVRLDELWLTLAELNQRLGGAPVDAERAGTTNERELLKRLEVLSDAVTELTRVMPRSTGRTAGIPGHLAELLGRIDQRLLAVERMGREQFELDQRLSGLEQMLEGLAQGFAGPQPEGDPELPVARDRVGGLLQADSRQDGGQALAERLSTRIAELEAFLTYTVEQRLTALQTVLEATLAPLQALPDEVRRLGERLAAVPATNVTLPAASDSRLEHLEAPAGEIRDEPQRAGGGARVGPQLHRVAAQLETLRVALVDGQGAAEVGRLATAVLGLTREVELVRRRLEHVERARPATDQDQPPAS